MTTSAEVELMETEQRWVQAHLELNVAELEELLDADYRRIEYDRVVGKEELLASYKSGKRHWDVAEASDYTVQLFADFAVLVGTWRGVGVNHGQSFDYRARFVAIYVKRPGGWKLFRDETFEFDI